MKKNYIRTLFGVTQEEMAMLLLVSRSKWSMYELGLRELPAHSSELLNEMLLHEQGFDKKNKVLPELTAAQLKERHKKFARLLADNEHEQNKLGRQLAAIAKKQHVKLELVPRIDFLNQLQAHGKVHKTHQSIAEEAISHLQTDHAATRMLLEHQLKVLVFQKTDLESILKDIASRHDGVPSVSE